MEFLLEPEGQLPILPRLLQVSQASDASAGRCGHYRCEGIPPDPDKSSLPPKNTMTLYVKEMIHFFIYYYDIANYDGGLRSQISNQLPLILCLIRQP